MLLLLNKNYSFNISDNFDDKSNETYDKPIDPQISKELLLYELYTILSNMEVKALDYSEYIDIEEKLKEFINNFLLEYELDPLLEVKYCYHYGFGV